MKYFIFILTTVLIASCSNKTDKTKQSLIGMQFQNFKAINVLADYEQVSDTSFNDNAFYEPMHGILHLQNQTHNLILFKSIYKDSINQTSYKILDTLIIKNLNAPKIITIGYCEWNDTNNNLIAIVNQTENLNIKAVHVAWQANTRTKKIEKLNDFSSINCINERFEGKFYP